MVYVWSSTQIPHFILIHKKTKYGTMGDFVTLYKWCMWYVKSSTKITHLLVILWQYATWWWWANLVQEGKNLLEPKQLVKSWCGLYTRTRKPFVSFIGWNNIKLCKTAINNPFLSPHLLLIVLNGFSKNSCPYHIKTNTDITYPILNRLILVVPVINMMNNVTQYM